MTEYSPEAIEKAAAALMEAVDWNIYYTAKGYRPHIEHLDRCVAAIMTALGDCNLPLDPWKAEAAGDALNDIVEERMRGYEVTLLNPRECVVAVAQTYAASQAAPVQHTAEPSRPLP